MKKSLILFAICVFAFCSFSEEKKLKVEASFPEWNKQVQKLEVVRQILDQSDLPNQQVKFATKTIDSLELLIVPQIKSQLDTTKKK